MYRSTLLSATLPTTTSVRRVWEEKTSGKLVVKHLGVHHVLPRNALFFGHPFGKKTARGGDGGSTKKWIDALGDADSFARALYNAAVCQNMLSRLCSSVGIDVPKTFNFQVNASEGWFCRQLRLLFQRDEEFHALLSNTQHNVDAYLDDLFKPTTPLTDLEIHFVVQQCRKERVMVTVNDDDGDANKRVVGGGTVLLRLLRLTSSHFAFLCEKTTTTTSSSTIKGYFEGFVTGVATGRVESPVVKVEGAHRIYIIGDLDGRLMSVVKMFLQRGLIRVDADLCFQWIAPPNVYVVQCGDQIDSARINKSRVELDVSVLLFFEYMRHLSNDRVVSILGNHEIMNATGNFDYVGDSDRALLDAGQRRKIFEFEGVCGRALRNRFLAMTINDVVFSHGCIDLGKNVGAERIDDLCKSLHQQFGKLTSFHGLQSTDFYKTYLNASKRTTVTWCRDEGGKDRRDSRVLRLVQDVEKHIYVRGHDKSPSPTLRKYSLKSFGFGPQGFQETDFADVSAARERIVVDEYVDVMADAYFVSTDSLPFGILDVDDSGAASLRASGAHHDTQDTFIHRIAKALNNVVLGGATPQSPPARGVTPPKTPPVYL